MSALCSTFLAWPCPALLGDTDLPASSGVCTIAETVPDFGREVDVFGTVSSGPADGGFTTSDEELCSSVKAMLLGGAVVLCRPGPGFECASIGPEVDTFVTMVSAVGVSGGGSLLTSVRGSNAVAAGLSSDCANLATGGFATWADAARSPTSFTLVRDSMSSVSVADDMGSSIFSVT